MPDSLFNCQRPTWRPAAFRQAEAGIYPTPPRSSSAFFRTARLFFQAAALPSRAGWRKRVFTLSSPLRQDLTRRFFRRRPAAPLPARQGEGSSYPLSPLASRPFRLFFRDRVAAFPARCASRRGRRFLAASRSAVKPSFDRLNVVSWQRSLFDAARRAARAGFSGPAKKRPRSFERGLWRKETWRRPTFPRMVTQYHRPWRA